MNEELRERVTALMLDTGGSMEVVKGVLYLFSSSLVKAQREAFVAGWLASSNDTNLNVHTEASWRYPYA